ncbi:hypothetical protein BH20ACT5_BH20ACT5_19680 [soil metagenome]
MTRVYLPATTTVLRALLDAGELGPPPVRAFAVTPALREWYAEADAEELEYAALADAARASLRMLDTDPGAARRRVVLAADVPEEAVRVRTDLDRSVVQLATAVALGQIAAAHVDTPEAESTVAAAASSVLEADLGSADAQFVVDEAEGHELAWYATQEIGPLLELL